MSDLNDLREVFGIYDCEDHDVIDAALDRISEQERASEEKDLLSKGKEVHRITLTKSVPATVVKAELNVPLEHDVQLSKFNTLDGSDYQSPGAWFVRLGFIVRSKKEMDIGFNMPLKVLVQTTLPVQKSWSIWMLQGLNMIRTQS